jgi:hypothetical protein
MAERIDVGPLGDEDGRAMLVLRGVEGPAAERLVRFARGNALAFELGALAVCERPDAGLPDAPPPGLPGDLVAAFLAGLDARDDFARLRGLQFVGHVEGALTLQDVVPRGRPGPVAGSPALSTRTRPRARRTIRSSAP